MANSTDFRADQVQTSKIIVTGSNPQKTLLIYSIDADGSPANQGNIDPAVFDTSVVGSDVFLFVSGAVGGRGGVVPSIAAFGGDLHISGNLTVDGTYPAGGGGGNDFFFSNTLDVIETSGSLKLSGSLPLKATYLSASVGMQVTGSLIAPTITGSIRYVNQAGTTPFLANGPNVTVNYNPNGQWAITGSGGGGGPSFFTEIALDSIQTTGSVAMTYLSSSTGARITGSITQGAGNTASGTNSFARGTTSVASGQHAFAEGYGGCVASGDYSHAEGYSTVASGQSSHSEGIGGTASGYYSHNEGGYSQAQQAGSHSEGYYTNSNAIYSHTEGANTGTSGPYSHAEGYYANASGTAAHAEGNGTAASGNYSHAEGIYATASGQYAHAEGATTKANGIGSHAEGDSTEANGIGSHAEGYLSKANGIVSHAEGVNTNAFGTGSFAAGLGTIASGAVDGVSPQTTVQAAFGKYNLGNNTDSLFVIGDGLNNSNRHDIFRVNSGSVQVTGSLEVLGGITGSLSGTVAGNPFIAAGTNITANYNSLGQWEITGSGGGSTAVTSSLIDYMDNHGVTPSVFAGNYTIGMGFFVAASSSLTNFKLDWNGSSSRTLSVKLWKVGVGCVGSVDQPVSANASVVGAFTSSIALDPYKYYNLTYYENTGTEYPVYHQRPEMYKYAGPSSYGIRGLRIKSDFIIYTFYTYASNDAEPTTVGPDDNAATIEPIF